MADENVNTEEVQNEQNNENGPGSHEDMLIKMGMKTAAGEQNAEEQNSEEQNNSNSNNSENSEEQSASQENEASSNENSEENSEQQNSEENNSQEEQNQETIFDITGFNKEFKTEYPDEASLKTALESVKRIGELEEQLKEMESIKEQNLLLKENTDPMKYFTSEDDFKVALFKKQFPDKDASVAYKLFSSDLGTMSDKELIASNILLETPDLDGGLKGALELVDSEYNLEEGEEIDSLTKNKMKVAAKAAKTNIDSLKSQITLPDKIDPDSLAKEQKELSDAKKEQLKEGWSKIANEMSAQLPAITLMGKGEGDNEVELFKYDIKDFPAEFVESMVGYMTNANVEITKDSAQSIMEAMQKEYFYQNRQQIMTSLREDTLAKAKEKTLNEQHNTGKPTGEANTENTSKDESDRLLNDIQKRFTPTQFFPKK
jgi:hypothetical protein